MGTRDRFTVVEVLSHGYANHGHTVLFMSAREGLFLYSKIMSRLEFS